MFNVINKYKSSHPKFLEEWNKLNEVMFENGMTWGTFLEETQESNYKEKEWCQYVTTSLLEMPKSEHSKIKFATESLFSMIQEVIDLFHSYPTDVKKQLLNQMGFSKYNQSLILNAQRMDLFSYLCRFDIIYDEEHDEYKCIEFNSATPMGLTESAISNSIINDYYNTRTPNRLENNLVKMWDNIRMELNLDPNDTIYFSSLKDFTEDRYNVEFQMNHASHSGNVRFIGLEDIEVIDNKLFDEDGNEIKYWYKLFPVEFFEEEPGVFKDALQYITTHQTVTMINPIDSFLAQNKGFYAWVWSLADDESALISDKSKQTIKEFMLPTYFEKHTSLSDYVVKPIFGREGNCVDIYKNNRLIFKDDFHEATNYYDSQRKIYQQYIEMPELPVETWDGEYIGKWLIGSYMLGGQPSGLYHRIGHIVTGSQSLYLPYTIK